VTIVRREVTLLPAEARPGDDPAWRDALVLVLRGRVELGRARAAFGAGSVVCAEGLTVRNPGPAPALLVAYARAAPGAGPFVHSALWSFFAAR
jgi:hypothetical protein